MVQSGIGETAAGLRDYSRTMGVDRAKRLIQDIDAKATGEALERMPSLHGVYPGIRDARGLEDLTKGFVTVKLPDGREQSWAGYYKKCKLASRIWIAGRQLWKRPLNIVEV